MASQVNLTVYGPGSGSEYTPGQSVTINGHVFSKAGMKEIFAKFGYRPWVKGILDKPGSTGSTWRVAMQVPPELQADAEDGVDYATFSVMAIDKSNNKAFQNVSIKIVGGQQKEVPPEVECLFAGDLGLTPETKKTTAAMASYQAAHFWGWLGDGFYVQDDDGVRWGWNNYIHQGLKELPQPPISVKGNHDVNNAPTYAEVFGLKTYGAHYNRWFYVTKRGQVAFVVLDTELAPLMARDTTSTYDPAKKPPRDDTQEPWLRQALKELQADPGIRWIIPCMHKNMYSYGAGKDTYHSANAPLLHPLFDQFSKVRLVLAGHIHRYERSHSLTWSGDWEKPHVSADGRKGQVYMIVGQGGDKRVGANIDASSDRTYMATWYNNHAGFLALKIAHNKISGQYILNDGATVVDRFEVPA